MTQEEYNQLVSQLNSLIDRRNQLAHEINELTEELNYVVGKTGSIIATTIGVQSYIVPRLDYTLEEGTEVANVTNVILSAIKDLEQKYFTIKNVSSASKKLTELDDVYQKKFRYYNQLRKVTLGYVIGIDKNIISNETLRKSVEQQQLLNAEYWVSYALSAVMLWINDEKQATQRAINKALELDEYKSSLYFMLVNLRFGRPEAARKWYKLFSKDTDIENIGKDWKFVLQAYLNHAFGYDKDFEEEIRAEFNELLAEMKNSFADFDKKIKEAAQHFLLNYAYDTTKEYDLLQENCLNYDVLLHSLALAETNMELAKYYTKILEEDNQTTAKLSEEIEDVLYDLVSAYDDEEFEIVKQIKLNEYIVKAHGNLGQANQMYQQQIEKYEQKVSLFDLMTQFAFADLDSSVDNKTRRFAISFMSEGIKEGYKQANEDNELSLNAKYKFNIDGCEFEGNDTTVDESRAAIINHYKKNKFKFLMQNRKVKGTLISSCAFSLVLIFWIIMLITKTVTFNPWWSIVVFVISLIGTILCWTLFGLFSYKRGGKINRQKLESIKKLQNVNEEFIHWKDDMKEALEKQNVLYEVIDKFNRREN